MIRDGLGITLGEFFSTPELDIVRTRDKIRQGLIADREICNESLFMLKHILSLNYRFNDNAHALRYN